MLISFGSYRARIRTKGGGLSELRYRNRDLVEPFDVEADGRYFQGSLLAPWPNRIRDGKYFLYGKPRHFRINEEQRNTAIHGLVNDLDWQVVSQMESELEMSATLLASENYPSEMKFLVKYRLNDEGLEWQLTSRNTGEETVPYGASVHPYLVAQPGGKVDGWYLQMPSEEVLEVDDGRLLPIKLVSVESRDFNFRHPSIIGSREIDHAFKIQNPLINRKIDVWSDSGEGVRMEFDHSSRWIQIHTADRNGEQSSRSALAVEPMSCPPDAFNSGIDIMWMSPGDEKTMIWKISAIESISESRVRKA